MKLIRTANKTYILISDSNFLMGFGTNTADIMNSLMKEIYQHRHNKDRISMLESALNEPVKYVYNNIDA